MKDRNEGREKEKEQKERKLKKIYLVRITIKSHLLSVW